MEDKLNQLALKVSQDSQQKKNNIVGKSMRKEELSVISEQSSQFANSLDSYNNSSKSKELHPNLTD